MELKNGVKKLKEEIELNDNKDSFNIKITTLTNSEEIHVNHIIPNYLIEKLDLQPLLSNIENYEILNHKSNLFLGYLSSK
jgi:hypothetical protein